jgi:phosphate acetyltransferase
MTATVPTGPDTSVRTPDGDDAVTSAASVYVIAPDGDTDKLTIALGLLHLLAASTTRVGLFRPIVDSTGERDGILELLLRHATANLDYDRCVGVSYERVHADSGAALAEIMRRYDEIERDCEAIVVLGSDYTDLIGPGELGFNGRVAANLGAPVVLVVNGHDRTPATIEATAELCLSELRDVHAHPVAAIVNRADPAGLEDVRAAMAPLGLPVWGLPDEPLMVAPTVNELVAAVGGAVAGGDPELFHREAMSVMVGGMTVERALERLTEGVVVIVPADRSDYLLAMIAAHGADGFPSLAGLILNGGIKAHQTIAALLAAAHSTLPIVTTELRTYDTAAAVTNARGQLTGDSARKVETALMLMERHVDGPALLQQLRVPIPTVVTPQRFEYELLARAKRQRRNVVLPEGDEDRILRAAGRLLERQIVDLTILGDPAQIRRRGAELGFDLSGARLIDPLTSALRGRFAHEYARLRAHKGMTEERAFEVMADVSYFGTMMVQLGEVDAMVSGAVHSTAHTIKPSFEIVKTEPGIDTVSSILLMCLPDRVLSFGDCAIVPNPTAEQLADIAIASAATASKFGIDPRVAMLSYSTGTSGHGADVDKVRAATEMVRARRPDILVEGPIQYDAAIVPEVAQTKLPDSPVAGRATVLVFPDLNTGNNTCKAVQRTAGALMIGPVLQGLRKPINDLSRGARVDDIVNTIAITAIQAQNGSHHEHSTR